MNIIFLTLSNINSIKERGIYADLMRKFRDEGHGVYIVSAAERRTGMNTHMIEVDGINILKVHTLNVQKTNVVEKGVGTLMMEIQYKQAIKKYLGHIEFDLVLYSTPPITFTKVIAYLKLKNPKARTYLLLKDIFPQNAVDLGMLVASPKLSPQGKGLKGAVMSLPKYLMYRYFRKKEKRLYALSDYIGCMSPANVRYIIEHNTEVDPNRVEVAPNSINLDHDVLETFGTSEQARTNLDQGRGDIREKYGLPIDKPIFIYGGNLGKPQGIPFLIQCLGANKNREDCHFVVIGTGTEYGKLETWYDSLRLTAYGLKENTNLTDITNVHGNPSTVNGKQNVTLMKGLPKEEYDQLVRACDVGLIFLDHRFTIPNFPSRLLSYLENKMPVLCATDPNCDMGSIAEENGFGFWCESNSVEAFTAILEKMIHSDRTSMGEKGYQFLNDHYLVENTYETIIKHVK